MSLLLLKCKALLSGAGIETQKGHFDTLRCKIDGTCPEALDKISEVGQGDVTNLSPF